MPISIRSVLPWVKWPAVANPRACTLLSLLFQIEQSQWQTPQEIEHQQAEQLQSVLDYSGKYVAFYAGRLNDLIGAGDEPLNMDQWRTIPLLSRQDIQLAGKSLHATQVPPEHQPCTQVFTSGSTGRPVITLATGVTKMFWNALTLRDHFWHRRDFRGKLASIRYAAENDGRPKLADNWGLATHGVLKTGPLALLSLQASIAEQAAWLLAEEPDYLMTYPSNALGLIQYFAANQLRLSKLKELRTFGEILEPQLRDACAEILRVPVVDLYSSQEVGYIALQCPGHEHYHVQSESVFVEVLDEAGRPCKPGNIGRVVVTTLHNFAMPLIRYDIGDYAEVGERCDCGRGLPVLKRILGRQRNLLHLPDGSRRWPTVGQGDGVENLPPFHQYQLVQRTLEQIDVKVVRPAPFSKDQEATIVGYVQKTLGHPFQVRILYVADIPRSPTGKFEDFRCELSDV